MEIAATATIAAMAAAGLDRERSIIKYPFYISLFYINYDHLWGNCYQIIN